MNNTSGFESILSMKHIDKSFSGVQVLKDVSFDLRPGEVHILAGENGAGKTTLIKILAGVHTDYKGEIILGGQAVRFKSPHDAVLHGISSIHQEMSLVNFMTAADNLFLGRELLCAGIWMDYRSQLNKAQRLMEEMEIDIDLSQPVENYPLSIRQMIEIAKALVFDAKIIIMDEPTSALNDVEVKRLFEIIKSLKKRGYGIIYISHRMEEIYNIGDRISVLRDGEYIGTAAVDNLPPHKLIQWMVGRELNQQFPPRTPSSGRKLLEVKNFSLQDPSGSKQWIVKDVSFSLSHGEIVGIAGLQGSGKSHLLNGLFGTFGNIDQGQVFLDNKPFPVHSPKNSIERGLALLTNDRKETGLIPAMNIARNISLASLLAFSPGGWLRTRKEEEAAARAVKSLDIKIQSLEQEVQTLSGGNQQKVVLARWLETNPKILLLDEPTIGVDVGAKHEIYRLMNQWTAEGKAILFVTSELPELLAMSDRIIVMHRGKITAKFDRDKAGQEKVLQAAMGKETIH